MMSELQRSLSAEYIDAVISVRHNHLEGIYEFSGTLHAKGEHLPERANVYVAGSTQEEALEKGLTSLFRDRSSDEIEGCDDAPTPESKD